MQQIMQVAVEPGNLIKTQNIYQKKDRKKD